MLTWCQNENTPKGQCPPLCGKKADSLLQPPTLSPGQVAPPSAGSPPRHAGQEMRVQPPAALARGPETQAQPRSPAASWPRRPLGTHYSLAISRSLLWLCRAATICPSSIWAFPMQLYKFPTSSSLLGTSSLFHSSTFFSTFSAF